MTSFSSGLSASIRSYLTLKRALGRQYSNEERVLAHLDQFLAARRVDLNAETFAAWCLTLGHLVSGTRRARMRIARNLFLYRGRSEPGCFVPDERLFPRLHQAIRPHIFTDNEIVQLLATTRTLARTSNSPLCPENRRLAIVLLSTTGLLCCWRSSCRCPWRLARSRRLALRPGSTRPHRFLLRPRSCRLLPPRTRPPSRRR